MLTTALLLAFAAQAQPVSVLFTPESISASSSLLRSHRIGLWVVRACNDGPAPVTIPPERFYLANPNFPGMSTDRASLLIGERYRTHPKLTIVRLIEYGAIAATIVVSGGLVAANFKVISSLGLSIGAAGIFADRLRGEVPQLTSILGNTLDSPVHLGPAHSGQECATRTVFSSLMPREKVVSFATVIQ